MRFLALIMNIALVGFFIGTVVIYSVQGSTWHLRDYVAVFLIVGTAVLNTAYLILMTRQPWFVLRRAVSRQGADPSS